MNATTKPQPESEDFSIVLGGPLYQLYRKAHLVGTGVELLKRRLLGIPLFMWAPLLVLSIVEGKATGGVRMPFLVDVDVHARCLVAVPLLILAEFVTHRRLGGVVRQFLDRQLIAPEDLPRYEKIVSSSLRLRNSVTAEVIQLGLAFAVHWLWGSGVLHREGTWVGANEGGEWHYTTAGAWYAFVTLPIFRVFLFRWYYRIFIWYRFLWKVKGLNLQLDALHPDRSAGLGFLAGSPAIFTPLFLAHSVLVAAAIQAKVWAAVWAGEPTPPFSTFKFEMAGLAVVLAILALTPLFFFGAKLALAKRRSNALYGALASRYIGEFRVKWLGERTSREKLIGNADIQSLADLSGAYDAVRETRAVPITRQSLLPLVAVSGLPLLPLALNWVDSEELIRRALGFLF